MSKLPALSSAPYPVRLQALRRHAPAPVYVVPQPVIVIPHRWSPPARLRSCTSGSRSGHYHSGHHPCQPFGQERLNPVAVFRPRAKQSSRARRGDCPDACPQRVAGGRGSRGRNRRCGGWIPVPCVSLRKRSAGPPQLMKQQTAGSPTATTEAPCIYERNWRSVSAVSARSAASTSLWRLEGAGSGTPPFNQHLGRPRRRPALEGSESYIAAAWSKRLLQRNAKKLEMSAAGALRRTVGPGSSLGRPNAEPISPAPDLQQISSLQQDRGSRKRIPVKLSHGRTFGEPDSDFV